MAARHGDAEFTSRSLLGAAAQNPEEHYRYPYGLADFSDPALVRETMDYVLGPEVRSQDTKLLVASLLRNPETRQLSWPLVRDRWAEVQKKSGDLVFGGNGVVIAALGTFCDNRTRQDVRSSLPRTRFQTPRGRCSRRSSDRRMFGDAGTQSRKPPAVESTLSLRLTRTRCGGPVIVGGRCLSMTSHMRRNVQIRTRVSAEWHRARHRARIDRARRRTGQRQPGAPGDAVRKIDPARWTPRPRPRARTSTSIACGGWIASHPRRPTSASYGRFEELQDRNNAILRDILEEAAKPRRRRTLRKIGDYYASCMAEAAIETKGTAPLAPDLSRVDAIKDKADIPAVVGHMHTVGMSGVLRLRLGARLQGRHAVHADRRPGRPGAAGPRLLPEGRRRRSAKLRAEYEQHVAKMLQLAGDDAGRRGRRREGGAGDRDRAGEEGARSRQPRATRRTSTTRCRATKSRS